MSIRARIVQGLILAFALAQLAIAIHTGRPTMAAFMSLFAVMTVFASA